MTTSSAAHWVYRRFGQALSFVSGGVVLLNEWFDPEADMPMVVAGLGLLACGVTLKALLIWRERP